MATSNLLRTGEKAPVTTKGPERERWVPAIHPTALRFNASVSAVRARQVPLRSRAVVS